MVLSWWISLLYVAVHDEEFRHTDVETWMYPVDVSLAGFPVFWTLKYTYLSHHVERRWVRRGIMALLIVIHATLYTWLHMDVDDRRPGSRSWERVAEAIPVAVLWTSHIIWWRRQTRIPYHVLDHTSREGSLHASAVWMTVFFIIHAMERQMVLTTPWAVCIHDALHVSVVLTLATLVQATTVVPRSSERVPSACSVDLGIPI